MWQERDSKCHRTKLSEPEAAAFVNRCSKTAERCPRPVTGTSTCTHATSRAPALVQGLSHRQSSSSRVPHLRPSPVCRLRRPSMTRRRPVHPRAASCQSMPADAPAHFGRPSLRALSPSSCIRPSFPLWTEPTAPPLPVLRRLHHVRPPAAPSARAAQPQPHTSFLAHATRRVCPCLAGAIRWWHRLSSSPVSATPTRPRPLHVSGPLFAHAVTQPASAQAYPRPRAHQCRLRHIMPRPLDSRSVISCPGPPVLSCPQPLSRANVPVAS